MPDRRALKILFDRYWSSTGWRPAAERVTPVADFEFAKHAGVMFDQHLVGHVDTMARAITAADRLAPETAANAFVASLSTRRLDHRSVLGSYAVFRHAPLHAAAEHGACPTCGEYSNGGEDVNVLSFERHKWGGVRHDAPSYAARDLECFNRQPAPQPTSEGIVLLRELVAALRAVPMDATAASLEKCIAPILRSNKAERDVVVAILGFCGVLRTPGHPNYRTGFVPHDRRRLPERRFVDMAYPACWWRAAYGLDENALLEYFGHVL